MIIISLIILISKFSTKINYSLHTIRVSVRVIEQGHDYCKLKWIVKNKSGTITTFLDGDIEQYEIRNTDTNKKYISEKRDIDIVLKDGDEYSNIILLNKLEKGRYECSFWAESEEGTKGGMEIIFEIK